MVSFSGVEVMFSLIKRFLGFKGDGAGEDIEDEADDTPEDDDVDEALDERLRDEDTEEAEKMLAEVVL